MSNRILDRPNEIDLVLDAGDAVAMQQITITYDNHAGVTGSLTLNRVPWLQRYNRDHPDAWDGFRSDEPSDFDVNGVLQQTFGGSGTNFPADSFCAIRYLEKRAATEVWRTAIYGGNSVQQIPLFSEAGEVRVWSDPGPPLPSPDHHSPPIKLMAVTTAEYARHGLPGPSLGPFAKPWYYGIKTVDPVTGDPTQVPYTEAPFPSQPLPFAIRAVIETTGGGSVDFYATMPFGHPGMAGGFDYKAPSINWNQRTGEDPDTENPPPNNVTTLFVPVNVFTWRRRAHRPSVPGGTKLGGTEYSNLDVGVGVIEQGSRTLRCATAGLSRGMRMVPRTVTNFDPLTFDGGHVGTGWAQVAEIEDDGVILSAPPAALMLPIYINGNLVAQQEVVLGSRFIGGPYSGDPSALDGEVRWSADGEPVGQIHPVRQADGNWRDTFDELPTSYYCRWHAHDGPPIDDGGGDGLDVGEPANPGPYDDYFTVTIS